MANLYAYVEIVKSGHKYEGEPPEVHEGETLTGSYRVAPAFSASMTTLPSVGSTASTDVWAEVLVTTHAQAPAVASSSSTGMPIIRKFPFAFDTPGLLTGAEVYTPTVGDILLDAWIEIDVAWGGGISPLCDIGTTNSTHQGLWAGDLQGPITMASADTVDDNGLLIGNTIGSAVADLLQNTTTLGNRVFPAKFTTPDPLRVWVTQDGNDNGADPGAIEGSAILYLVTCTPI